MPTATSSAARRGSLFYFAYFGALAIYYPFLNVYFSRLGLSGLEIGVLAGIGPALTVLLATPLSALADHRSWRKRILSVAVVGVGIAVLSLVFPTGFWALVPLMALRAIFFSPATSLADSMIVRMAVRHRLNYGGMRLWGSLSFAIVAIACGALWQHVGYRPMFVLTGLVYFAVAGTIPALEEGGTVERQNRAPLQSVFRDRLLLVLLVASFLVACGMGMDLNFAGIYMTRLGGGGLLVGALYCVAALCELPTMRYSARLAARIGWPGVLLLSYVLFVIAYVGYALSPNPEFLLVFSAARGLAYGLFYVSTVRFISDRTPPEWSATLQSVITGTTFAVAQLIAGPILRWSAIAPQLVQRVLTREGFVEGVRRFVMGFAKKMIVANIVAVPADKIFALPAAQLTMPLAWFAALCYALQIYFDFSAYSDMAIGLGKMFGFKFLENFNYPYVSLSIREFWRRWHMSLSGWFRDYLYIPMGGNHVSTGRNYFNLITVFFLCGLWHGASWTFVIWGLYHGIFLVLERTRFGTFMDSLWRPLRHGYALLAVVCGWVIFRADTFSQAAEFFKFMSDLGHATQSAQPLARYVNNEVLWSIAFGVIFSAPTWPCLKGWFARIPEIVPAAIRPAVYVFGFVAEIILIAALLLISAAWLAGGTYNPFIYYRF